MWSQSQYLRQKQVPTPKPFSKLGCLAVETRCRSAATDSPLHFEPTYPLHKYGQLLRGAIGRKQGEVIAKSPLLPGKKTTPITKPAKILLTKEVYLTGQWLHI